MTCIVGIEDGEGVIIGGDSAGVAGYSLTIRTDQKVFESGEFVYGFTSSFRMGQILRYSLTVPQTPHPGTTDEERDKWMTTTFIDAVRSALKTGGFAKINNGVEEGGCFLVGWRGRLYVIDSDFQVGRTSDGYAAVGCGADLALGALHATKDLPVAMTSLGRVTTALEAATRFSAGVSEPFHLVAKDSE